MMSALAPESIVVGETVVFVSRVECLLDVRLQTFV